MTEPAQAETRPIDANEQKEPRIFTGPRWIDVARLLSWLLVLICVSLGLSYIGFGLKPSGAMIVDIALAYTILQAIRDGQPDDD